MDKMMHMAQEEGEGRSRGALPALPQPSRSTRHTSCMLPVPPAPHSSFQETLTRVDLGRATMRADAPALTTS